MRFLICLLFLWASTVQAAGVFAQKDHFTLEYGVYAGGFKALNIQTEYMLASDRYSLTLQAQPYGVIGKILPWAGNFTSKGRIAKNRFIPDSHMKISRWAEDNDQDEFTYKDGVLVKQQRTVLEKGHEVKEDVPLYVSYHKNSVDILTAVMQMLGDMALSPNGLSCNSGSAVYDGKRRFRLQFTGKGTETLKTSDYNIYDGKAQICEVELIPQQGFNGKKRGYYKIQEDARAAGQLPRVWLAPLWEGGPMLPVRMLVKSEYGAVLAHVQKVAR